MSILPVCPSCGLPGDELRCPRCNTLKVVGCSGSCASCRTRSECGTAQEAHESQSQKAGG